MLHKNEKNICGIKVPIAVESFISMKEHIAMFKLIEIKAVLKKMNSIVFMG
jgi:hypothetical protein